MQKIAALFLAAAFAATAVRADETKIALDKLPKAVVDGVKKMYPKAKMEEAVKDVAGAKTSYEVTVKDGETNITVTLTDAGVVTSLEKEIALKAVPKNVMAAVMAKYPKGKPTKAEEVCKVADGKEAFDCFEVILDDGDKKGVEVYVSKEGKILDR